MSEVKTNKLTAATGTAITLGDSGDTFTIPAGATLTVAGALNVTGTTSLADGTVAIAELDIDGGTDIGDAIVDADLFIVVKSTQSRQFYMSILHEDVLVI